MVAAASATHCALLRAWCLWFCRQLALAVEYQMTFERVRYSSCSSSRVQTSMVIIRIFPCQPCLCYSTYEVVLRYVLTALYRVHAPTNVYLTPRFCAGNNDATLQNYPVHAPKTCLQRKNWVNALYRLLHALAVVETLLKTCLSQLCCFFL